MQEVWRFGLKQGWNGGQGEEERGLEILSQPGMERRTEGGGKRMGDLVSTRDRTEDRVL
jgi:hypothetical protein